MPLFTVHIHHHHSHPPRVAMMADLAQLRAEFMSALSDAIKAANDAADAAVARVTGDLDTLTKRVADLQAQVDAGAATPDDLAALAALQTKLAALDVTNPATLPPDVSPPQILPTNPPA